MNFWLGLVVLFALLCALVINLAFLFAAAAPAASTIAVRDLRPVGGVHEIRLRRGETIRFDVVSDRPEAAHLHGYGIAKEVGPGMVASFAVPAQIEGAFTVELVGAGVQIAAITVEGPAAPRGSLGALTDGAPRRPDRDSSHGFLT